MENTQDTQGSQEFENLTCDTAGYPKTVFLISYALPLQVAEVNASAGCTLAEVRSYHPVETSAESGRLAYIDQNTTPTVLVLKG